ncbi:MAG: ABC transporter permease [Tannerellaceae bacterium]|nr:ABC transporter permease [Tannerellaceae bacterium]
MKNLRKALRTLFKKSQHNGIKILSLGVGLSLGLVLITKVYFEQTYNNFYPDVERIFRLEEGFKIGETEDQHGRVSGGVAPGMQADIPEVEAATRMDVMGSNVFYDESKRRMSAFFLMADTGFFDVLPRPMLVGNAKDILTRPMYVLLSEKMAAMIHSDIYEVIGRNIWLDNYPGRTLTIGGIFKDVPENTELKYDAVISLTSFYDMYRFDCTNGWLGCDRFMAFVKLYPGVTPEDIAPAIRQMQERHQDMEEMRKAGVDIWYNLVSLKEAHGKSPETRKMTVLLSLLAFALIFTAVMNYVLIVISTMVGRTKEVAVNKCFGASGKDITRIVLTETAVHLVLSLFLAALLILVFRESAREILNTSVWALFTVESCILLGVICGVVFLVAGLIPSWLLTRIPIAAAFRSYKESKRMWKLGLLFVQVAAAGFLVSLVLIINRQYNLMVNFDMGYNYENVVYVSLRGVDVTERDRAKEELMRLPVVEDITSANSLMIWGYGGNNILPMDGDEELMNLLDLEAVEPNFLDMLAIPVVEGRGFERGEDHDTHMMLSRSAADKLKELMKWDDGVVGKNIRVTGQDKPYFNIIGVYEDVIIGALNKNNTMLFGTNRTQSILLFKLTEVTPENMALISDIIETLLPDKDIAVSYYRTGVEGLFNDSRVFRKSVLIGGIVTLLISLIGLIGYVQDEINRRSAEVAIRKINGATIPDIEKIFLLDILYMSIPALLIGDMVAWYAASTWQQDFTVKTPLSFSVFLLGGVFVLVVVLLVASWRCYEAATANPVDSLKKE